MEDKNYCTHNNGDTAVSLSRVSHWGVMCATTGGGTTIGMSHVLLRELSTSSPTTTTTAGQAVGEEGCSNHVILLCKVYSDILEPD